MQVITNHEFFKETLKLRRIKTLHYESSDDPAIRDDHALEDLRVQFVDLTSPENHVFVVILALHVKVLEAVISLACFDHLPLQLMQSEPLNVS